MAFVSASGLSARGSRIGAGASANVPKVDVFVKGVTSSINKAHGTSHRQVVCMASKAKFFIGGNWKCNGTFASVDKLVSDLNAGSVPSDVDIVCAPTFLHLDFAKNKLAPKYQVAAQNCWVNGDGAYTGEISAEMLRDEGVKWVILGHSERRSLCGESNEIVGKKCEHALETGLSVIACVGETLEQRNGGNMFKVLDAQMKALVDSVKDWSRVVIAYEPVWAIGTGTSNWRAVIDLAKQPVSPSVALEFARSRFGAADAWQAIATPDPLVLPEDGKCVCIACGWHSKPPTCPLSS